MKIRYLGHSCFCLTSDGGTRIVTDPYGDVGFCLPKVEADVVTVSHSHYDHNNVKGVKGSPVLFAKEGRYEIGGVRIDAIPSFHDDAHGALRGKNLIFKFRMDGLNICHLGDLGERCTEARVASVFPADVLLIPVGGVYTVDAEGAKEYADRIKPAVVIPMHYKTRGLNIGIAGPERFLGLFGENTEEAGTNEIELTRENIGGGEMKIIKLERSE